jgi:hypothetical protein
VMQVSGAKSWRVWDDIPFPLPSRATPWANKQSPAGTPHALTLIPGDALYLPRGVMHEAAAQSGDAPSLHITFGFLEASIADILRELLEFLEAENPALRTSIPSRRLAEAGGTAAIAARLAPALAALSAEAALETLALAAMDRITRDRLPLSQRSLAHRPPGADAKLRLSDAMHHHLVPLPEGGGALRWYGGVENLSATECAWLAQLAEGATPASLGEGALAFCQRLAALGYWSLTERRGLSAAFLPQDFQFQPARLRLLQTSLRRAERAGRLGKTRCVARVKRRIGDTLFKCGDFRRKLFHPRRQGLQFMLFHRAQALFAYRGFG